jgi:hypothetical protein
VRLPEIMHMEANLLDGVGDVGVGEHHLLEAPDEALILTQISNRMPRSGGDLGLHVLRSQDRLTVRHASTLKDVEIKLALSEEESIGLMLYRDPQKVVKRVEVLHGEFLLESRYGVLQGHCARCREHNVMNIKQQVYRISVVAEDEQGVVELGLTKTQTEEVSGEPVVPSRI